MKRAILFIVVLMLFTVSGMAQFTLGVKAGYNTSLGFDQNWNFNSKSLNLKSDLAQGFHIGAFARLGRRIYAQPELTYNIDISDVEFKVDGTPFTDNVKIQTLDLPVLLGYKVVNTKLFNLRLMVGPKFRFNLNPNLVIEKPDDIIMEAKKAQVGLDTGIGIDVWFLSLDVRYNLINQFYHYKTADQTEITTKPLNAFTVSLGWKIIDIHKSKSN